MLWQLALVLLAATHGVCSGLVDTATIPKPDGDTQADPKPVAAAEGMPDKPLTQELKSTYSWSQFSAPRLLRHLPMDNRHQRLLLCGHLRRLPHQHRGQRNHH